MILEVEITSCSFYKEKKTCFRRSVFMIDYISAYNSQLAFMELDSEADKPRVKAELRVIMTDM